MPNYYFLGTLLPDLIIGEPPEIGFYEFIDLLKNNLSANDMEKVRVLRSLYDLFNLRVYWKSMVLDPFGNFDANDLEEAFATQTLLPNYVFKFMEEHESTEDRLKHFHDLISTFLKSEAEKQTGFLKWFLELERDLRLVMLGFRAKKMGRDLTRELQNEDPEEEIIAQLLAQKESPVYEPPDKYEDLRPIFEKYYDQPLEIQRALLEYRFRKIDEHLGITDSFSINRILAYLAELILVEKWQELDKEKGLEIMNTILKEAT